MVTLLKFQAFAVLVAAATFAFVLFGLHAPHLLALQMTFAILMLTTLVGMGARGEQFPRSFAAFVAAAGAVAVNSLFVGQGWWGGAAVLLTLLFFFTASGKELRQSGIRFPGFAAAVVGEMVVVWVFIHLIFIVRKPLGF